MTKNKLIGMGVALVTPFNDDGSIDYDSLGNLIEYQIDCNTNYLVVCGTTAETPTLTPEEKEQTIRNKEKRQSYPDSTWHRRQQHIGGSRADKKHRSRWYIGDTVGSTVLQQAFARGSVSTL